LSRLSQTEPLKQASQQAVRDREPLLHGIEIAQIDHRFSPWMSADRTCAMSACQTTILIVCEHDWCRESAFSGLIGFH
jgi:hypothetical protein